ncbi:hypothetical protein FF38_03530 [Lucilia cuprina]|uniref:Uncharacterized protein n=1 Tax=Lucilia cuprina TaxID=7375 RepID=A0A0L0CR80_LUCCU|nr:hypothetical protein FF38_03530 [Lucilia cuprina]
MSRGFENIFEKFNITYTIPRKRQKKSQSSKSKHVFHRNRSTTKFQEIVSSKNNTSHNLNSSCYFNNSTIGKYNFATRYKTLEVIGCENVSTDALISSDINNSITKYRPKMDVTGKDNTFLKGRVLKTKENFPSTSSEFISVMDLSFNKNNTCDDTAFNISPDFASAQGIRKYLSSTFNIGRKKLSPRIRSQSQCLRYNKLNVIIDKPKRNILPTHSIPTLTESKISLNDSLNSFTSSSTEASQIIETPTITQESVNNVNTELDLLIDLIEREDKNKENHKQKFKDLLPRTKNRLKGGYEELFERALKRETVKGNFLKHDRKLGLRLGKVLKVVDIETAYGVTVAVVKSEDLLKIFGVVVAPEMLAKLKLGGQIEAYFDDKSLPYKLPFKGEFLDIYLEPFKLLIV